MFVFNPADLPQQHGFKEEVLTELLLDPSLDQQDPEALRIKDQEQLGTSPEGEQLVLEQEADEERDHSRPEPTRDHQRDGKPEHKLGINSEHGTRTKEEMSQNQ